LCGSQFGEGKTQSYTQTLNKEVAKWQENRMAAKGIENRNETVVEPEFQNQ